MKYVKCVSLIPKCPFQCVTLMLVILITCRSTEDLDAKNKNCPALSIDHKLDQPSFFPARPVKYQPGGMETLIVSKTRVHCSEFSIRPGKNLIGP
ncbi:hypothetical protein XELAEV_18017409mg [Xenopus laevis]|uniref:Uncharacterized protein n=1 Tax=Xenopus laevis TaxID=8355 RepID=A0A974DCC6_XENLA|nr:hypothetical protein XELAEV_18017409mg [Xenopus laevis]